jgi:hypothetical protein
LSWPKVTRHDLGQVQGNEAYGVENCGRVFVRLDATPQPRDAGGTFAAILRGSRHVEAFMADQPQVPVPFIDSPHTLTVYATGIAGLWLNQGAVHMTFETGRIDHSTTPGAVQRVAVGTLVMPVGAAQAFAVALFKFLSERGAPTPEALKPSSQNRMQ